MKITWIETKDTDWKVATILDGEKEYKDVSINRKSKKGEIFPNFDELAPEREVNGTLWESSAHKWDRFPPRTEGSSTIYTGRFSGISKAQDTKRADIATAQGNKELSIKVASTINQAIGLAIAEKDVTPENILKWRKWIWEHWSVKEEDFSPFPSSSVNTGTPIPEGMPIRSSTADAEAEYNQA